MSEQQAGPGAEAASQNLAEGDDQSSVFGVVSGGTPEPGERSRLAAMVFTDVVGYSKRMGENEEATIAAVDADFARMRELCGKYGGEVLNTMGDGMMLCFDGAVAAMKFALEMQTEFAERNAKLPYGKGLQHRVGMHIGDVFRVQSGHMAGDGVNIAARLEPKAPHGGVAFSQIVYDTVKGKVQMKADRMGPQSFKNISQPIVVWTVALEKRAPPVANLQVSREPERKSWPWLRRAVWIVLLLIAGDFLWPYRDLVMPDGNKDFADVVPNLMKRIRGEAAPAVPGKVAALPNSVAVLPFTDRPDKEGAWLADGLQDDLVRRLGQLGEIKVVSRASTLPYRGAGKSAKEIGRELGVAYLVQGSAQREGGKLRLQARLVSAQDEKPLWSQDFDRDAKDLAAVQGQAALSIIAALKLSPPQAVQVRLARPPTENLQAWELFMRQQALATTTATGLHGDLRTLDQRAGLLSQAVAADPRFAMAWAGLALNRAEAVRLGVGPEVEARALAQKALAQAQALGADEGDLRLAEGAVRLHVLHDPAKALQSFEAAAKAMPSSTSAFVGMAEAQAAMGGGTEALAAVEQGLKVDGRHAGGMQLLALMYERYRLFPQSQSLRTDLADHYAQDPSWRAEALRSEYNATGSWAAWDKWRADAGKGLETRSSAVRDVAVLRAAAARDADELRRLADLQPDDLRGVRGVRLKAAADLRQALALAAAGDKPRAAAAARAALGPVDAELARSPGEELLYDKAMLLALLGQKAPALAAAGDALQLARKNGDRFYAEELGHRLIAVQALLGDRAGAMDELRKHRGRPGFVAREVAVSPAFAPLWDDPEFKALLAEPASHAPVPVKTRV